MKNFTLEDLMIRVSLKDGLSVKIWNGKTLLTETTFLKLATVFYDNRSKLNHVELRDFRIFDYGMMIDVDNDLFIKEITK